MKNVITMVMSLVVTLAFAQRTNFGPMKECFNRSNLPQIALEDKDHLFLRSVAKKTWNLQCINKKNLQPEYNVSFTMDTEFGVVEKMKGSGFFNGDFAIFNSFYHRSEKRFDLKMTTIDTKTGSKKSQEVIWSKEVERNLTRGFYRVVTNPDANKILIHTLTYYNSREVTEEKLILLDKNLEVVVQKDFDRKGDYETAQISNLLFDLEGSVFYFQNDEVVMLDAFNNYEEWREPILISEMELDGKLKGHKVTFDDNYDLVITALYVKEIPENQQNQNVKKKDRQTEQLHGVFYQKISGLNKETKVSNLIKFANLPREEQANLSNLVSKFDPKRVENVKIFFKDNGDFILTFEEYARRIVVSQSGNTTADLQFYGNIGVIHISEAGEMLWGQRIGKKQYYKWAQTALGLIVGSHGLSFLVNPDDTYNYYSYGGYFDNDVFYIAFNDHIENRSSLYEEKEPKKFKKVKHSMPILYSLDIESGAKKRKSVRTLETGELRFVPRNMFYSKYNEKLYFFNQKKDDFCLAELEL